MLDTLSSLDTKAKVLPLLAVLAFFVSFGASSSRTVNGVMTECSHFDLFALAIAAACLIGGGLLMIKALRPQNPDHRAARPWHAIIGVALILVSAVHAVRAFGVVGGPCN